MNIKKLIAMLIVGIMLMSLLPLALADDETPPLSTEPTITIHCQNYPPPNYCPEGENVIANGIDENDCTIWECEEIDEEEFPIEPEPECVYDIDCDEGYICYDDECKEVIVAPSDEECIYDTDCVEGYFCNDDYECKLIVTLNPSNDAECVEDSDCDEGYVCDVDECRDEEEVEFEADEEDVKVFKVPHGAEVRLIQLERSVDRNIVHGERVIAEILENDENANVDALLDILEEMGDLLDEIRGLDLEDKTPEELAEEYVEIKSKARGFSKEFRDAAREFFSEGEANIIRGELRVYKSDNEEEYKVKFEKARNAFNEESLRNLLGRLGINEDLIEQVLSEADFEETKGKIVSEFQKMAKEKQVKAVKNVREEKVKVDVFKSMTVQNSRYRYENEGEFEEGYKSREREEYEDENGSYEIRTLTQINSYGEVVIKEQVRVRRPSQTVDE